MGQRRPLGGHTTAVTLEVPLANSGGGEDVMSYVLPGRQAQESSSHHCSQSHPPRPPICNASINRISRYRLTHATRENTVNWLTAGR